MEFLQSYWLWILVAIGVGWFLMRRGGRGMGCGTGGHGGHGSSREEERPTRQTPPRELDKHAGHEAGGPGDAAQGGHRRRGGC